MQISMHCDNFNRAYREGERCEGDDRGGGVRQREIDNESIVSTV